MQAAEDEREKRLEDAAAAGIVRTYDRDRYWSALFAPEPQRAALLALYAFDVELARIPQLISEAMVGQIRLQWWRDAVDLAAPGAKTGNPVADALTRAILTYRLPKEQLIRMADARLTDIYAEPPAGIPEFKAYLVETAGAVFEMAAAILGAEGETASKAAEQAGLAYGLTLALRTLPQQASKRNLLLPLSALESKGVDAEALFAGETTANLRDALSDLRESASKALSRARAAIAELDKAALPAFLPLALVKPYLKLMEAPGFDPLRQVAMLHPVNRFWRIWRAAWRGKV